MRNPYSEVPNQGSKDASANLPSTSTNRILHDRTKPRRILVSPGSVDEPNSLVVSTTTLSSIQCDNFVASSSRDEDDSLSGMGAFGCIKEGSCRSATDSTDDSATQKEWIFSKTDGSVLLPSKSIPAEVAVGKTSIKPIMTVETGSMNKHQNCQTLKPLVTPSPLEQFQGREQFFMSPDGKAEERGGHLAFQKSVSTRTKAPKTPCLSQPERSNAFSPITAFHSRPASPNKAFSAQAGKPSLHGRNMICSKEKNSNEIHYENAHDDHTKLKENALEHVSFSSRYMKQQLMASIMSKDNDHAEYLIREKCFAGAMAYRKDSFFRSHRDYVGIRTDLEAKGDRLIDQNRVDRLSESFLDFAIETTPHKNKNQRPSTLGPINAENYMHVMPHFTNEEQFMYMESPVPCRLSEYRDDNDDLTQRATQEVEVHRTLDAENEHPNFMR